MCRARVWAFCIFLVVCWEGNAVSPIAGFSFCSSRTTTGGRDHLGEAKNGCFWHPALWEPTKIHRAENRLLNIQCVGGPQDGTSRSWRAGDNRLIPRATAVKGGANSIPEVSRQTYQDAALSGLITVGQEIPRDWVEGDQFAFSAQSIFKKDEIVVFLTPDGNTKFGKVLGPPEGGAVDSYNIQIDVTRLGAKYVQLAAANLGKVLALSQREIQRLGSSNLPSKGSKVTVVRNGGLFSSFRNLVDVDKKSEPQDTLPFQPMLSRRASSPPPAELKVTPKPEGRVSTVMSGADSGDWGELDGWWRNEEQDLDYFEVLLQRPLGMDLHEVEGEGIFVQTLEEGGNAQLAGVRVGDRIQVPGNNAAAEWREDLVSVLSAISEASGNRMRLRYVRSSGAASSAMALAAGGDAKQQARGKVQSWRGTRSSAQEIRELQVLVKKPIGMRLTEIEGQGIYVSEIEPDGNAARVGIRVGDRVMKTSVPPGFESGIEFDRGTTYFTAVYSKNGASALQRFISEVKAPGGAMEIGLSRTRQGQLLMEQFVARERLGGVDATLSAKVKRAVFGPFMAREDAGDEMGGAADAIGGEGMLAVGRPLRINLDLLSYSARLAMKQGNTSLGEELYELCMRVDPYDGRGWLGMAKLYERREQLSKAREILVEGLTNSPQNAFLLQALGCLEAKTGNLPEAHRRFQQATVADPTHAASWVSWGKLEERFRRPWRARQCYAKAAAEDPANYYAWQCLAVLESKSGDSDAARALFKKCTDVNPNNAASWQAWGTMERKAGNWQQAATLLERGLRSSPKNTWVMQALALLEWERGNTEKAEELFTTAIQLKPWDGGLYQAFGVLLHASGNLQRARMLFQQGSKAAKDHAALWQAWAEMEAGVGRIGEARELFQQGVWSAGSDLKVHNLWQAWGLFEATQLNFDDARKYLARAVDVADRPANALVAWALIEERQGALLKSRDLLEKAVTVESTNAIVWAAYLRFARRVYGEASKEATDVYQRKVVSEIRSRSDREEAFPQLLRQQTTSTSSTSASQSLMNPDVSRSGDIFVGDDFEVLMKAKWGSGRKGTAQAFSSIWMDPMLDGT